MIYILLMFFMITDLLIPFVIAIPYKKYNHTKSVMSVLGCKESPWGSFYNIWMILSGCAICLLGYMIFDCYNGKYFGLSLTLFILILLYGAGDEIISGIFPLNEKKYEVTVSSKIHGIGSVLGFIALQFAPLFLSIIAFKSDEQILAWISTICFILSMIAFCFFVMGEKPKFQNTIFALEGLWQRVLCLLMYIPFLFWLFLNL